MGAGVDIAPVGLEWALVMGQGRMGMGSGVELLRWELSARDSGAFDARDIGRPR